MAIPKNNEITNMLTRLRARNTAMISTLTPITTHTNRQIAAQITGSTQSGALARASSRRNWPTRGLGFGTVSPRSPNGASADAMGPSCLWSAPVGEVPARAAVRRGHSGTGPGHGCGVGDGCDDPTVG